MTFYFLVHLTSTAFMAGLIWVIQLLHYPFFDYLERTDYALRMDQHRLRISYIVIPVMLAELGTGVYLLLTLFYGSLLFIINVLLLVLIWLSTFTLQMPTHMKLVEGHNTDLVNRLVQTNWIRTTLWTLRLVILLYLSIHYLSFDSF